MENGQQSKTAQYALIQALYWMSFCMIFSFASVYLLDKGFSNTAIGLLIGISGTISAILQPWIGGLAGDGAGKMPLKRMMILLSILMLALAVGLLLVPGNKVMTVLIYGTAIVFLQVLTPLSYSLGMACINRGEKLNFGLARGLGSLAYAGISYAAGFLVASVGTVFIPASVVVIYGVMIAAVRMFGTGKAAGVGNAAGTRNVAGAGSAAGTGKAADAGNAAGTGSASGTGNAAGTEHSADAGNMTVSQNVPESGDGLRSQNVPDGADTAGRERIERVNSTETTTQTSFFKRYPRFFMLLIGSILVFVSHNMLNNFAFQIMESKGGGSSAMGTAIALAAASELPIMFLFGWLVMKIRCDIWLKISGLFFFIKAAATILVKDVTGMYMIQGLQMFGFALFVVASVYYVNMIMKEHDRVKGQAFMTMTNTLGGVLGSSIGGALIDGFGIQTLLLASTAVAACGMVLMSVAARKQ